MAGAVKADADADEHRLRQSHQGAKVLVAEDNEINRMIVRAMLEAVGLRVELAIDGRDAFERAAQLPYDLILIGMQLPNMDGLKATRAIRTLPGWSERPILALTANGFADDRRACEAAGMNDFLTKPVSVHQPHVALLKWLPQMQIKGVSIR